MRASLAAHAPYSVAPLVFRALHDEMARRPFLPCSVHLAESREETEFIAGTDLWFRPIHTRVGPDGALYFCDLGNQVIRRLDLKTKKMTLVAGTPGKRGYTGDGGKATVYFVSGGFAEVQPDRVTILAQNAERADEIDIARAEAAKKRAEDRLQAMHPDMDFERARIALMKSLIRLQVATRARVRG